MQLCDGLPSAWKVKTGGTGTTQSFVVPSSAGYMVSEVPDEIGDAERKRRAFSPVYVTRDGSLVLANGTCIPSDGRMPITRGGFGTIAARSVSGATVSASGS